VRQINQIKSPERVAPVIRPNFAGKKKSDHDLDEKLNYVRQKLQRIDPKTDKPVSIIEQSLGSERLLEIAESRSYADLRQITDNLYAAVYWLSKNGFNSTISFLLEQKNVDSLFLAPEFKSSALATGLEELSAKGTDFSYPVDRFVKTVLDNLDKKIFWKPMVEDLLEMDPISATEYFCGSETGHIEYLKKWDESVALLDEAISRWGLQNYVKLVSQNPNAQLFDGSCLCTTPDGKIFAPPYESEYPEHGQNMTSLKVGIVHECGHHRWKSFRINMHPGFLKLNLVGAEFDGSIEKNGRKIFRIRAPDHESGSKKNIDVRTYSDIFKIVKYPKLLSWLHNVADDKRVDSLNVENFPGLADDYIERNELALQKRPELKKGDLGDLLEGLLQKTVCGHARNDSVPKEISDKLDAIEVDLSDMEIHEKTDGTDSLNVALKWYVRLEPELDELADRIEVIDGDFENYMSQFIPEDFGGSDTSVDGQGSEVVNEDPGKIRVSRNKRGNQSGGRRSGTDPFSFLDIPGSSSGEESGADQDGESQPGQSGSESPSGRTDQNSSAGNTSEKPGKDGEEESAKEHSYDEWTGNGYRRQSKVVREIPNSSNDSRIVVPPAYLRKRVERLFRRYAPKEGKLVRGLESGYPDPVLQEQWFEKMEAGFIEPPNYHSAVVFEKSNVVISIGIDFSGSMSSGGGQRPPIDVALEGAATLGAAANVLRFPVEVSGFTGGDVVDYHIIPTTKDGLVVPEISMGATPMAGAVRHATVRAIQMKKKFRKRTACMFFLTDGAPNSSGDGINPIADTGAAMEEARKKGIKTFGVVTTGQEGKQEMEDDYRTIFGGGRYVVVESFEKAINPLLNFMKRIVLTNR
jgi:hypothetical protein